MSLLVLFPPTEAETGDYVLGDYGYGAYGAGDYGTSDPAEESGGGGGSGIGTSLYALTVASDLPVLWYRMNATSGVVEEDHGSLALPGTYVNSPTLNQPGALEDDPAVAFDRASSQQLNGVDNDAYSITAAGFTVEILARFDVAPVAPAQRIFTKFKSVGSQCEWALERFGTTGAYTFRVFPGSSTHLASASFPPERITLGSFHHFVATVERDVDGVTGILKAYLDGGLVDTETFTFASLLSNGTAKVVIGGSEEAGFNAIGTFDEAAIYSTALSAARVLAHYSALDPGSTSTVSGPQANLEFETIFALHPASVLGTGNNPDLIVNGREAV